MIRRNPADGSPFGKPRLEDSTSSLTFNVSHSGERAIFGFARSLEIGVDVEKIDPRVDIEEVARATFAKAEVDALLMLPEAMQRDTFFRVWSRKEAYMKALGVGFSLPPSDFTVSVDPREPPKLLRAADDDSCEAMGWTLSDIVLPEGYAAAFAVPSVSARASILEWAGANPR